MAVTINASTSAGAVTTADTSGVLQLQTGGTTALTVDASQNVGVGTSSPATRLHVSQASGTAPELRITSATVYAKVIADDAVEGMMRLDGSYKIGFNVDGTERARIDSSGNLLVGTTDSGKGALTVGKAAPNAAYGQICALSPTAGDSATSGMSVVKYANDSTTAQVLMRFLINQGGAGQGQINANGANTAAFGSYSDSRLKENIVDLPSQLDSIMALRPVEYDYIESMGGGHQIGFVAQEVQAIYPDLVGEDAEGMLTLTDMNKNDARLIKCIQEQQTLITQQAEAITALTTRITALEGAAA